MDIVNKTDLVTKTREEYYQVQNENQEVKNALYQKAIFGGILTGVLVSLFLAFGGFYITGDHAGIGFAKYIVLAITLGVILVPLKKITASGQTFKRGLVVGMLCSTVAAIVTALGALIVNSLDSVNAVTLYPYFLESSNEVLSSFILSGVTLFEGIVAGLILTFIWLQILKDPKRAK